jgi:hypothetical protein
LAGIQILVEIQKHVSSNVKVDLGVVFDVESDSGIVFTVLCIYEGEFLYSAQNFIQIGQKKWGAKTMKCDKYANVF